MDYASIIIFILREENEGSAPESKTKITVKMHNMEVLIKI